MRAVLAFLILMILCGSLIAAPPEAVNLRRTVVVDVVERTKDSVVYISTKKLMNQQFGPFADPFFRRFELPDAPKVPVGSLGSGFIVHRDGYVVTNNHVVDRAREITVELLDGRKLPADLISSDPEADLAILKIHSDKPLPVLELGDSSDLMIGEPAIAVGNPFGFSHTVSTGIVSALHRDLKDDNGNVQLGDLIQTDAAINPGNSGGPLLNAYGQVIGINTALRGDAQNIGFAISVNRLRDLVPELMDPHQANKLSMGIKLKEVCSVTPPANVSSQVMLGDRVVTSIAGEHPANIVDAYAILLAQQSGKAFDIAFSTGPVQSVKPVPAPLPDAVVQANKKMGLGIEQLTPMLAQQYGLQDDDGLFVKQVSKGTPAERAGIQPGDVIVQIGMYRIATLDDFAAILQAIDNHPPRGNRVRFIVRRGEQLRGLVMQIGNADQ